MPKPKYILEVNLGEHNGTVSFITIEEIERFIKDEDAFWSWVRNPTLSRQLNNQPQATISSHISQIITNLSNFKTDQTSHSTQIISVIETAFKTQRIPLSNSPVGVFIDKLKEEDPLAAGAALISWMSIGGLNLNNFSQMKGVVLMAAFDAKITSKTPAAVNGSLKKLDQTYRDSLALTQSKAEKYAEAVAQSRLSQRKTTATLLRSVRKKYYDFRKTKTEEIDNAITSIKETEALYKVHMQLKGPVEYWSSKAANHIIKAGTYRNILTVYGVIAGLVLVIGLYVLAGHAIEIASTDKPPAIYLILTTLGVVVTTIIFWIARILTRLFLSEHHLAIDAEERAVMAQTYLALSAENLASDKERAIVLTSLFRPTADGIVKDDAAPDFSPTRFMSGLRD